MMRTTRSNIVTSLSALRLCLRCYLSVRLGADATDPKFRPVGAGKGMGTVPRSPGPPDTHVSGCCDSSSLNPSVFQLSSSPQRPLEVTRHHHGFSSYSTAATQHSPISIYCLCLTHRDNIQNHRQDRYSSAAANCRSRRVRYTMLCIHDHPQGDQ